MNPADQWLAINAKYFPTEQVQYIRQRLEALPEQQLSMLYSISFALLNQLPRSYDDAYYLTFCRSSWNRPLYVGASWSWSR